MVGYNDNHNIINKFNRINLNKMHAVWITLIEGIILLAFTVYLVWEYAAIKRTPLYVRILTIISWFLGLTIIIFIPLDIYSVCKQSSWKYRYFLLY